MKIFHTGDWHIGKTVNGFSMLDDQEYVLEFFVDEIRREKPDLVMIAGDLYDAAVASAQAVSLFGRVLRDIVDGCKVPVLAIAGNHDSPARIDFVSELLSASGLFIKGKLAKNVEPVIFSDAHGEVHFHLVPYADPSTVRELYQDETIQSHDDAMRAILAQIRANMDANARHVLVGHAFVTPGGKPAENTSDSEKKLNAVGGAEQVNADLFEGFHYVALGHLHRAHEVGEEQIRYSGSILKYSLSEASHVKGFTIIELAADGTIAIEQRALPPRRDLRQVIGTMEEIERSAKNDDYVFVTLLDSEYVPNFVDRVRNVYPNVMSVERQKAREQFLQTVKSSGNRTEMSLSELFHNFFVDVMAIEPSSETVDLFEDVLQTISKKEREQ